MTSDLAKLTLNNGVALPALGLGVYRSSAEETLRAVSTALAAQYRLIDTAAAYRNEAQVVKRSAAAVSTAGSCSCKLWISDYGYDTALHGFERSMHKLVLDTADLYLLHQPMPNEWESTVAAWKAIGRLFAEKRARAIGVSNLSCEQLADLIERMESSRSSTRSSCILSSRKSSCARPTSGWVSPRKRGRRSAASCATSATIRRLRKARFASGRHRASGEVRKDATRMYCAGTCSTVSAPFPNRCAPRVSPRISMFSAFRSPGTR